MIEKVKFITPAEAKGLTEIEAVEVESVLTRLNDGFRRYSGERFSVDAKSFGHAGRVRDAVLARIKAAGWRLEFQSDQREGDFYWVSG